MKKIILAITLIAVAVASRLLPHQPNFTAVLAAALFAGAYLSGSLATFVALASMAVSDAMMGYYNPQSMAFDYSAMVLVMLVGMSLTMNGRKIDGKRVISAPLAGSIAGSILFFVISNLGVFLSGELYPLTWSGLVACYVAAIPFFRNTILSTLTFSLVLFASYEVALKAIRGGKPLKRISYN